MRKLSGKTYWLVGASEGLGRALAQKLSKAGVSLVLSARGTDSLNDLAGSLPGPARVVACDVSDRASVLAAAQDVGAVDGLVFLAGVYWPQPAQEWNAEQVEAMFDVNLTGAARVLGQVVPAMVARGAGHVVITGSLSGYRGLPGAIGYASSKAGLMHLAESIHCDLRGTGVDVQLAVPGFIRTRLTEKERFRHALHHGTRTGRRRNDDPHALGQIPPRLPQAVLAGVPGRQLPARLAVLPGLRALTPARALPQCSD